MDLGDALTRARDPLVDLRDRALCTELVMGTLRWRGGIDYQLQRLTAKPLARLDEEVLDALRLGAYQILHLDRLPLSAIVNDAVAIVKAARMRSASGFVNAILRRLAREREHISWPERPGHVESDDDRQAMIEHLSVVHSHPPWLVTRWIDRYGIAVTEAWLTFNNRFPATTLAANRLRGNRDALAARLLADGVSSVATTTAPHGLTVVAGRVLSSEAFRDGACVIQDEASQIISELAGGIDGGRILDACASPGGKTLALAAISGAAGLVVATDVRARRVALLAETMRRCRLPSVHIVHVPVAGPLPFQGATFDRVLVDAPCSGLGTVRRDPDIRWRRQASDLPALAAAQLELLERIAPLLAPAGRLIYSTCSSEPEENEGVVARFLRQVAGFSPVPIPRLTHIGEQIQRLATPDGYLRTSPLNGLEAFFAAVLEKAPRPDS